jgi:hypothetical protein
MTRAIAASNYEYEFLFSAENCRPAPLGLRCIRRCTAVMSSGANLYAASEDDESYSYTAATNSTRRSANSPLQQRAAPARPSPVRESRDDAESVCSDSSYSYYSSEADSRRTDASTGQETGRRTVNGSSLVEWLSLASFIATSAFRAAAAPAPKKTELMPRGLLYTPREAPRPRRRAGRMGSHGRIAAIPWHEMVTIKETLLGQMEGTASAEERLDERAAVGVQYAAALQRAGAQLDAAIAELLTVVERDASEERTITAQLQAQLGEVERERSALARDALPPSMHVLTTTLALPHR